MIEPTLQDYTGHCHSYVSGLLKFIQDHDTGIDFKLWVGKKMILLLHPL